MEQLRIMLGKESTKNFTKQVSVADRVQRRHRRPELQSGLASGADALKKAGRQRGQPAHQDWYVELQKEQDRRRRRGEMMAGRIDAGRGHQEDPEGCADEAAKDDSIKKYKH